MATIRQTVDSSAKHVTEVNGIPASGKPISVDAIAIHRVSSGKGAGTRGSGTRSASAAPSRAGVRAARHGGRRCVRTRASARRRGWTHRHAQRRVHSSHRVRHHRQMNIQFADVFDQINALALGTPVDIVNPDVLDRPVSDRHPASRNLRASYRCRSPLRPISSLPASQAFPTLIGSTARRSVPTRTGDAVGMELPRQPRRWSRSRVHGTSPGAPRHGRDVPRPVIDRRGVILPPVCLRGLVGSRQTW